MEMKKMQPISTDKIEADWNILEIVPLKIHKSHVMLQLQGLANSFGMFWIFNIFNIQPSAILGARTTDRTMRRFVTELHRKYEETGRNIENMQKLDKKLDKKLNMIRLWFELHAGAPKSIPQRSTCSGRVPLYACPSSIWFDAISVSWQARAA